MNQELFLTGVASFTIGMVLSAIITFFAVRSQRLFVEDLQERIDLAIADALLTAKIQFVNISNPEDIGEDLIATVDRLTKPNISEEIVNINSLTNPSTKRRKLSGPRKKRDSRKFTKLQIDFIKEKHLEYVSTSNTDAGNCNSVEELTEYLNNCLNLNKSASAYSRVWLGTTTYADAIDGPLRY